MANAAMIQSRINKGLSKAGRILGTRYAQYRPVDATAPIVQSNLVAYVTAAFSNDWQLMFQRPSLYHSSDTWFGFMNSQTGPLPGGGVQPGDYFIGEQGTLFATDATSERFVALHFVWCNRTINIGRALDALPSGGVSSGYSGQSVQNLTSVLTQWPCSLRIPGTSGRARDAKMKLPSDALEVFYAVLLPPLPVPFPIKWNDIVSDDLGRNYVVNGIEQTPLGTRLAVEMWPS